MTLMLSGPQKIVGGIATIIGGAIGLALVRKHNKAVEQFRDQMMNAASPMFVPGGEDVGDVDVIYGGENIGDDKGNVTGIAVAEIIPVENAADPAAAPVTNTAGDSEEESARMYSQGCTDEF